MDGPEPVEAVGEDIAVVVAEGRARKRGGRGHELPPRRLARRSGSTAFGACQVVLPMVDSSLLADP
ncbi:hypothetical protein KRM28CT15_08030 [Krasilnikovia sp. M28-CT-15]